MQRAIKAQFSFLLSLAPFSLFFLLLFIYLFSLVNNHTPDPHTYYSPSRSPSTLQLGVISQLFTWRGGAYQWIGVGTPLPLLHQALNYPKLTN